MSKTKKFLAFISYSHADRKFADRLQSKLEAYQLPNRLRPRSNKSKGKLGRFFRDQNELQTGNSLGTQISSALGQSQFLIVLCSPEAAQSKWVNREIQEFKRLNGDSNVLSAIIGGTPNAPAGSAEECFPQALLSSAKKSEPWTTPKEPISADFRTGKDGPRLALLKLIAPLVGIELAYLLDRDQERKTRRVTAITASSVFGMLAMSSLAGIALQASREAERERTGAEGLIEFMLTDLRDKLEGVGRLDVLDSVALQARQYYDGKPISSMDNDSLGRRARVLHDLGEVQYKQGNLDQANQYFISAYSATEALLSRDRNNEQRIFEHSQSAYWAGFIPYRQGDYDVARRFWQEYDDLASRLLDIDGTNPDWWLEKAYSLAGLGTLSLESGRPKAAIEHLNGALSLFQKLQADATDKLIYHIEVADTLAWLADAHLLTSHISVALDFRTKQIALYTSTKKTHPNNIEIVTQKLRSLWKIIPLYYMTGDFKKAENYTRQLEKGAEQLLDVDRSNLDFWEILAISNLRNGIFEKRHGDFKLARSYLEAAQQNDALIRRRNDNETRHLIRVTLPVLLLETEVLIAEGHYTAASDTIDKIFINLLNFSGSNSPERTIIRAHALFLKGVAAECVSDKASAENSWQELASLAAQDRVMLPPQARFFIALAHAEMGNIESANHEFIKLEQDGISVRYLKSHYQLRSE